jgi:hypothetical protein
METPSSSPAVTVEMQAPVLTVRDLFPPDTCARFIDFWEASDKSAGVVVAQGGLDAAVKQEPKRRLYVFIPDGHPLLQEVTVSISATIGPAVLAAFQFRIEVIEGVRIGCYDAAEQGYFRAHHDNTTPATAHRRFAITINLNTGDYQGGALRFPDYGPQLYVPPRGGAEVFSCLLLHEVLPVTVG